MLQHCPTYRTNARTSLKPMSTSSSAKAPSATHAATRTAAVRIHRASAELPGFRKPIGSGRCAKAQRSCERAVGWKGVHAMAVPHAEQQRRDRSQRRSAARAMRGRWVPAGALGRGGRKWPGGSTQSTMRGRWVPAGALGAATAGPSKMTSSCAEPPSATHLGRLLAALYAACPCAARVALRVGFSRMSHVCSTPRLMLRGPWPCYVASRWSCDPPFNAGTQHWKPSPAEY